MTDSKDHPPRDPGFYSRPTEDGPLTAIEITAGALTLVWLALVGGVRVLGGSGDGGGDGAMGSLGTVLTLVAVFLPVAMIWIAALTARTARTMRDEARRLQAAIDAMRHSWLTQQQAAIAKPSVERKIDEIAAAQRQTETALATFTSRRDSGPAPARKAALVAQPAATATPAEEQPALALGTPAEALNTPVSIEEFVRALNFPDSQDDREGFRALRRALEDRTLSRLVRAAQDVLTLLSQDGIYMDDLRPDRARVEIWRKFAQGERGRGIAALGGVRDRSSLALTAARMRQDTVFRDAAHHFLRQFDKTFSEFEKNASDTEIADLAETRTARAFMLLGRVTGTFD